MATAIHDPKDGIVIATAPRAKPVKLVFNGAGGAGRTSFLTTLLTGTFPAEYVPTVFDNFSLPLQYSGRAFDVGWWDIQGGRDGLMERYDRELRPLSYVHADVMFFPVDCANPETLRQAEELWWPQALQHVPTCKFVLLVLKTDLRDDVDVLAKLEQRGEAIMSREEAEEWGAKHGMPVIQVSAKRGDGMKHVLRQIIDIVIQAEAERAAAPTAPSRVSAFFKRLFGRSKATPVFDHNPPFSLSQN